MANMMYVRILLYNTNTNRPNEVHFNEKNG